MILGLATGTYFGLDPVGARIWQLMAEGKSLGEICDLMLEEYDLSRDDSERNSIKPTKHLTAQDLISPA